jgi:uncharacterized damage-inducible protein DinB
MSEKEMIVQQLDQEIQTTLRVLKAYPEGQLDLRPSEKSRTARELAWTLVTDTKVFSGALDGPINFQGLPKPPQSLKEIIAALEESRKELLGKLGKLSEQQLQKTVKFPVGPKQMGDVPLGAFGWVTIKDHVHHRGQFSVYLRLAGGKLPSIYGPTADEPWM